jgi:hypothetical protein
MYTLKDSLQIGAIANSSQPNVKALFRQHSLHLRAIRAVARMRRAHHVRIKSAADFVLVLLELERRPLEEQECDFVHTYKTRLISSLFDVMDVFEDHTEFITNEIENAALLLSSLYHQNSWTGVCTTVLLYIKTHCRNSIFSVAKQFMDQYIIALPSQDASSVSDESVTRDWLATLKSFHRDWKVATTSESFSHVSKLVSMMVAIGLFQASDVQCTVKGMKLFSDLCIPKFVSAYDLFDAVLDCIMTFVEGGYECIKIGSLRPLLNGETRFTDFDEKYLECRRVYEYAMPGNLGLIDVDENAADELLRSTLEEGKALVKITKNPMSRKLINDRLKSIQEFISDLDQFRMSAKLRVKPFTVCAHGGTSVGKSTFAPLIMHHILAPNGYDANSKFIVYLKAGQRWQDHVRSYINGVHFDDFGNVRPEFCENSPCDDFLDVVNTAQTFARMAALELKNKVTIQNKATVITTNVKDLNSSVYSNEPASICRRADVYLDVRVRPQFATNDMLDRRKVEEHYDGDVPKIPDCWLVTIETAFPVPNPTPGQRPTVGFAPVEVNGVKMVDVDMKTALRFIVKASREHFEFEKRAIERNSDLAESLQTCKSCGSSEDVCVCDMDFFNWRTGSIDTMSPPVQAPKRRKNKYPREIKPRTFRGKPLEQHSVTETVTSAMETTISSLTSARDSAASTAATAASRVSETIEGYNEQFLSLCNFLRYVPMPRKMIRSYISISLVKFAMVATFWMWLTVICSSLSVTLILDPTILVLYVTCIALVIISGLHTYVWLKEKQFAMQRQHAFHWSSYVVSRTAMALASGATIALVYKFAKRARAMRQILQPQGYMDPTQEDIDERDENDITDTIAEELNWANVEVEPLPSSSKSKTITDADLLHLVTKNTAACMIGDTFISNMLFVCSNVALMATHSVKKWENQRVNIIRHDISKIGGNFHCDLSRMHSVPIPDTDVSMVYVPAGGSWKSLLEYFPVTHYAKSFAFLMPVRSPDGSIEVFKSRSEWQQQLLENGCTPFGHGYDIKSYKGMCGSALVAQKIAPMITGIHVAGKTGSFGFASSICQSDLEYALEVLGEKAGVLIGPSEGNFPEKLFDKPVLESSKIHVKSPLNKLEFQDGRAPNIRVFGTVRGRATYRSKVITSPLSPHVKAVCGVPQRWGAPKFQTTDPFRISLQHTAIPSHGVAPKLLTAAVEDYTAPLLAMKDKFPKIASDIRPLTQMETVCGMDGKKFVNKMPSNSSPGFPFTGATSKWLILLDPEDYEGFENPAELDPIFWEQVAQAKAAYRLAQRYYPIFKGCLKDEPTLLTKDKVRVFQAAPMVLKLLVRQYFLPIARFVSLFPKLSECAVGLNPMGPDWEEFDDHINKFGVDRILAGDYSKYDLRLPAQLTLASFRIMIDIAKHFGYSEDDILIMKGIAYDVAYPVIAYNGDLLQFVGSNPSGQNLTVYINSIANSLLMRCAFYAKYPEKRDFRKHVALGTFGDDVKGSVHVECSEFNHITTAEFLAKSDMTFTMPDKTSTPTKYMHTREADFLQRNSVYIPEIDRRVGALKEDSIFKSLHANLKSRSETPREVAASCLDGAIREWFFHGRQVFEHRQAQMREVAHRAEISHFCTMLDVSYPEMARKWCERYKMPLPEDMESPENNNPTDRSHNGH